MTDNGRTVDPKQHIFVGLILLFLFINLYCYTGILPLTGEEDRRCIIAQEMLLSGDYLHPTVFNVPYYRKPPMHNWLIALANARDGVVDRVSARTVSIAALLITGLSMYLFLLKKRPEGAMVGFLAVTTNYLMMCEYGNLAETDVTVTVFTFLSFILYLADPTRLLCIFLSSLFMGAGILTKGLSPFFFYPAVLVVTLTTKEKRGEKLALLPLHLILSLLLPALWLWLFSLHGNLHDLVGMLTQRSRSDPRGGSVLSCGTSSTIRGRCSSCCCPGRSFWSSLSGERVVRTMSAAHPFSCLRSPWSS
jgi:4-amino-4-deoxy-L-arabinose transferase-like glycosyltransferase